MKKLVLKMTVVGMLVFAACSASTIEKTRFDGPPVPTCTPTACLPPTQLPPLTGGSGG